MKRNAYFNKLDEAFELHPVVAILGPRQCGKTTLATQYTADKGATIYDLENPRHWESLSNPMSFLERQNGLIVIDEIQRLPELFPVLRVLVDNPDKQFQFLILGSASRELIKQSSETLAGRIEYIELTPFNLQETQDANKLWVRGGYPRAYLASSEAKSHRWHESYITTFLEQDIPNLGFNIPAQTLRRFWMMLTHYHGQIFNASQIGSSLGVSHTTVRHYLDILVGTFLIRELKGWEETSIKKRQVKTSKILFRDSGLFHTLAGIPNSQALNVSPCLGASWEGFALEEIIRYHEVDASGCYYWRTHADAELDLLINTYGKRMGFEFKCQDAPKVTKSMQIALKDLKLDKITVIFPGKERYPITDQIEAVGLETYIQRTSE